VTHAANYIQGNGSTGFFNGIVSPSGMGLSNTSGCVGVLVIQADSRTDARCFIGSRNGVEFGEIDIYQASATAIGGFVGRGTNTPVVFLTGVAAARGLFLANRNASGLTMRRTLSASQSATAAVTMVANQPISTNPIYLMGLNQDSLTLASNARIGAGYMGLGMSTTNADAFAIRLRNLYQDLTGTTIPST
jgi:hypothetical protein